MTNVLRFVCLLMVLAALVIEGYYIATLRERVSRQTEELKYISMQLQSLKIERDSLSQELSLIKKTSGEHKDEHTADR